jgi:RHS repeat-associated protein
MDHEVETRGGIYYYGYRHYSPELGRWLSRDPIAERGGINLYGFCYNNAVAWYDVFGKQPAGETSPTTLPGSTPIGTKPNSNCLGLACQAGGPAHRNPGESNNDMMKRLGCGEPVDCNAACPDGKHKVALYTEKDKDETPSMRQLNRSREAPGHRKQEMVEQFGRLSQTK